MQGVLQTPQLGSDPVRFAGVTWDGVSLMLSCR